MAVLRLSDKLDPSTDGKREPGGWVALAPYTFAGDRSGVLYSDDGGGSWAMGELLPKGWTECQVAELRNGSVLLTSRNFYDTRSGYGPRLFARSDEAEFRAFLKLGAVEILSPAESDRHRHKAIGTPPDPRNYSRKFKIQQKI